MSSTPIIDLTADDGQHEDDDIVYSHTVPLELPRAHATGSRRFTSIVDTVINSVRPPPPRPPRRRRAVYADPPADDRWDAILGAILGPANNTRHHPFPWLFGMGFGIEPEQAKIETPKFSSKLSHPRKLQKGFRKDIVPLSGPGFDTEEEDNAEPVASTSHHDSDIICMSKPIRRPRQSAPVSDIEVLTSAPDNSLTPLCTSCSSALLLGQPPGSRPYILRCGHIICGPCYHIAKARVEARRRDKKWIGQDKFVEISPKSKRGKGKAKGKRSTHPAVDQEEYLPHAVDRKGKGRAITPASPSSPSPAVASSSKGVFLPIKPGSTSTPPPPSTTDNSVNPSWTSCPLKECVFAASAVDTSPGTRKRKRKTEPGEFETDLLDEGGPLGAWEMFI